MVLYCDTKLMQELETRMTSLGETLLTRNFGSLEATFFFVLSAHGTAFCEFGALALGSECSLPKSSTITLYVVIIQRVH
ncbi:uncharacterized protein TRIVIDRAFT_215613, partial [Trichoderma virens Gv29-8]